jgi:predicted acyl esterase
MKRLPVALAFVLTLAAAPAAHAAAYTTTDDVATMDDGVGIAVTLYQPVGLGPARAPGVMVFHGLGGNRQSIASFAQLFAENGYVVLSFDFRGHGQSGGLFSGLGARELADVAILRERWLPEHSQVSDRVGGWGLSLGGGALLRSIGEGEPFAAAEVAETWTDLYDALVPQGLPKSGAIFQFLGAVPRDRQAPELLAVSDAVARVDVPALKAFAGARSSRQLLARGYPPTYFFQGRQDFAFGLEQGIAGYQALTGPKRLYVGPFGHAPSTFPGPDFELQKQRALAWFDRYLKGVPNGIENGPKVELVAENGGTPVGSATLPRTQTKIYALNGRSTIGVAGKVVRRVRLPRAYETFGAPTVDVRASSTTGWSHLVAVLVARTRDGRELVISEGGAPTRLAAKPRGVRIRLISTVKKIPAGSRLELTLAGTSTAQNPANLLYLVPVPQRARITVRNVSLAIPFLRTPVTR